MHMHCMLYPQQTSLKYVYAHTLSSFFKELCMPLDHPCEGGYRIFSKFGAGEED